MNYKITFSAPENLTSNGMDGCKFGFSFSYIDETLIGTPEEKRNTKEHRLIISISSELIIIWGYSDADLIRILFEIAQRQLREKLASADKLSNSIELDMLTTFNQEKKAPFDPSCIPSPDGYITIIEVSKRLEGFNPNA